MACNNTTYNEYIFNHTELHSYYYTVAFIVDLYDYNIPNTMRANRYVTLVWVVIGIFGNIVSALVWANPRMRTCNTAAYYLTCLSIADLTFLVLCFIYELENPWLLGSLDLAGWCQIFNMANMAVQYFCVFLVFAFTVERFLSMWFPFKSERFGKTRTPRIIICLLGLAVAMSLPQLYFWSISIVGECGLRRDLEQNKSQASLFSIFNWSTEMAVFGVLPLVVLVLNIAVLYKIRHIGKLSIGNSFNHNEQSSSRSNAPDQSASLLKSIKRGNDPQQNNRASGGTKSSSSTSTTVTVLMVSFFLILTMLPNTLMYVMQEMYKFGPIPCRFEDMSGDSTWREYFSFTILKLIIKEISLTHHVFNVFIYMATSRHFLKLAVKIVFMRPDKAPADTTMHTIRTTNHRGLGDGV